MNLPLTTPPPEPVLPLLPIHPERLEAMAASVPEKVRRAMFAHPLMRQRLLARYYGRMGVAEPDAKSLGSDARRILAALIAGRGRFAGLAGLVWHGHTLGRAITPAEIGPLLAAFAPGDIAIAVSMKLFAPRTTPPPLSAKTIATVGDELVRSGAQVWGGGFARLVEVLLPPRTGEPNQALSEPAAILLGALAYRMQQSNAAKPRR